jgi:hypothetical protein
MKNPCYLIQEFKYIGPALRTDPVAPREDVSGRECRDAGVRTQRQ